MPSARVLIVGSGFSGLGLGYKLKQLGIDDFVILERAADVGGVWNLNTYPGCNCDVPSHLYSFSFAPNPEWTSTYSPQPEIRAYLQGCVDRFGLRGNLRTGVEVTGAAWNDAEQRWEVDTSEGQWRAQVLVSAMGPLTEPRLPDVPGIETFTGKIMHSSRWDHDYDLAGKRVASIGTGASAIQYVPRIADQVEQLFVFQRSAPWIIAHDKRPITDDERERFRRHPAAQRRERNKTYLSKEILVLGFVKQPRIMRLVEGMSRKHLERQVADPQSAVTVDARVHDRMQTDRAIQRVVSGTAKAERVARAQSAGGNQGRNGCRLRRGRARGGRHYLRHWLPCERRALRRQGARSRRTHSC